ncbi:ATP-binding protein [Actinoallomurus sp. CA-150999]|uniref:ATP-binding protein n=1 Tax=Actinoallomurus sp. CA-150999 TaxID=3239887 RepID=UPI003D8B8F19
MAAVIIGTLEVPAMAREVRNVRRWLRDVLPSEYRALADDIVLLGVELVTNALRHSDSAVLDSAGHPGRITVAVLTQRQALRVTVSDAGSSCGVPRMIDRGPGAETGRGLRMLDVLTGGRWGVSGDQRGRTVWFEVSLP